MFSSLDLLGHNEPSQPVEPTVIPPPSNYEEWLEYNNLENWPQDPLHEIKDKSWLQINVGSMDDLRDEISAKVPCQVNLLDDILKEVLVLEDNMSKYCEFFFNASPRAKKTQEEVILEKYARRTSSPKRKECSESRRESRMESRMQKQRESLKSKNMELAEFPGYHSEAMMLPGALEAPQLLNRITKLQQYPLNFRKVWKQFFLSEASVCILQDAFWWIFLEYSKKSTVREVDVEDVVVSQSKLFDRMANNFVSLFISLPYTSKDSFFRCYPNCLSQALYAAFSSAFPLSTSKFNIDFREYVVGLIFEWVCGVQPECQQILKTWKLSALEGQQKISVETGVDEPLQALKSHLSFNEDTFLDLSAKINKEEVVDTNVAPLKKQVSHPASSDVEFKRIFFNVFGQSPFVKHYLSRKHLQNENEILNKIVTRTERNEKKMAGSVTYSDIVNDHKTRAVRRKQKHDRMVEGVTHELRQCTRTQKTECQKMKKFERDLLKGHSDIKILSQKIMDMLDCPSVTGGKQFVTDA